MKAAEIVSNLINSAVTRDHAENPAVRPVGARANLLRVPGSESVARLRALRTLPA